MPSRLLGTKAIAHPTLSVHSVHYSTHAGTKLEFATLAEEAKHAEEMVVFSAYYSPDFLRKLLKAIRKPGRCCVSLVFNGFAGRRLADQLKELGDIVARHQTAGFTKLSIYLNLANRLFHTKLYRFKSGGLTTWLVGSANASNDAFGQNEELLLGFRGNQPALDTYVRKVIASSTPLDLVERPRVDNLVKFFRTGLLYFKQTTQIQFTFSLPLPDDVSLALIKVPQPRNTEPGEPWGAYNVKRFLKVEGGEKEEIGRQARIKHWAVETCFGFWVPTKYAPDLDAGIDRAATQKRANLEKVRDRMVDIGLDRLVKDYRQHLEEVGRRLAAAKIPPDKWTPPPEQQARYGAFIHRLSDRLRNPEHVRRASRHLDAVGMPEIWTDPVAASEFTNSFFQYVV